MTKTIKIKFEDEAQFERIRNEKERRGLNWRGIAVEWWETSRTNAPDE